MQAATMDAYRLMHEGAIALAEMSANGIRVDEARLDAAAAGRGERIGRLESKLRADPIYSRWRREYGRDANLWSDDQLTRMLFDVFEYPYSGGRTEKTGKYQATDEVVSAVDCKFARRYVKAKKLKKAKSTYLDGLKRELVNGYVHPSYNLHLVETYRSSADHPNIQNQLARDEVLAAMIRQCYVASRPSWCLTEVDYVTHEWRVAASFWKDPAMLKYIKEGKDPHYDVTSDCYAVPVKEVSKGMRSTGKNGFTFPILYGSYYVNCARNLWEAVGKHRLKTASGVPVHEALKRAGIRELGDLDPRAQPRPGTFEEHIQKAERKFMKRFPVFGREKDAWYEAYRKAGGFPLMTGFYCRGLYSRNNAMNTPIQGPAFHCLLWAIPRIMEELKRRRMETRLVAEIHDSILGDGPEREVPRFLRICRRVMVEEIRKHWDWIIAPLEVDAAVSPPGSSWADKKPWYLVDGRWIPKE